MAKHGVSYLCALSLGLLVGCAGPDSVQDTCACAQYFADELAFTANPSSMKKAVKSKDASIVIVDLRKREHYKAGHVPGAVNLPFDEWNGFDGSKSDFSMLDKTKMHYVYCYEQYCSLSARAAYLFASNGYPVKEIKGGFKAYKDHKYPVEASK